MANSEAVIAALKADARFEVTRVPNGTNIFYLRVKGGDAQALQRRAQEAGLKLAAPRDDRFAVLVNETWARISAREILTRLA